MLDYLKELRQRLIYGGVQDLCDADLLHFILASQFNAQTSEKLHRLLATYPRLYELMQVDFGELVNSFGLNTNQAAKLLGILELARRIANPAWHGAKEQIKSYLDIGRLLMPQMAHLDHEEMRVLLLDTKLHVIANHLLYKGTVHGLAVRISEIFKPAVSRNCSGIILVHNHPAGDTEPSDEDKEVTLRCKEAGEKLDIELVDHVIIAPPRRFKSILQAIRESQPKGKGDDTGV